MQTNVVKQYKILSVKNKEKLLYQIMKFEKDGWKCVQVWYVFKWFYPKYEALVIKEIKLDFDVGPISTRGL